MASRVLVDACSVPARCLLCVLLARHFIIIASETAIAKKKKEKRKILYATRRINKRDALEADLKPTEFRPCIRTAGGNLINVGVAGPKRHEEGGGGVYMPCSNYVSGKLNVPPSRANCHGLLLPMFLGGTQRDVINSQ